jgi:HlyD family secretion protein
VNKLYAEEGDAVTTGQLLAELDPQPYLDQVLQAKANVQTAEAALVLAERTFARKQRLIGSSSVSQQEFEDAESQRDQALAQLAQAKAAVGTAETGLKDTKAYCPADGWILTRIREPGTVVNIGEPVFSLSVKSPLWIRAYVDEPDLGEITFGMPAEVHTDTKGGRVYQGHVGFISPLAEFTPKTVQSPTLRTDLVYRLRIYVTDPDEHLRQGQPVTIVLKKKNKEPGTARSDE